MPITREEFSARLNRMYQGAGQYQSQPNPVRYIQPGSRPQAPTAQYGRSTGGGVNVQALQRVLNQNPYVGANYSTLGAAGPEEYFAASGEGAGGLSMSGAGIVAAIIAAADIARQLWGGDPEQSYADKTLRKKMFSAPGTILANPGFNAHEVALYDSLFGKDNVLSKVGNFLGQSEMEVVGEPLDALLNEKTLRNEGIGQALDNSFDRFYKNTFRRLF